MHAKTKSDIEHFLKELGVRWFGIHEERLSEIPAGAKTMVWMNLGVDPSNWASDRAGRIAELTDYEKESFQFHTATRIQNLVAQNPGAAWMIMGEVNRRAGITPATFAVVYKYYYEQIKAADPTALVLGPAALNWDFTCIGGCNYGRGREWITSFVSAYKSINGGALPPVDVWPLQVYPIDWTNVPNGNTDPAKYPFDTNVGFKRPHWQIATSQITGFRSYLDLNGYPDTPIWITETAIHWGYDGNPDPVLDGNGNPIGLKAPTGTYYPHFMADHMNNLIDWMEQNAQDKLIERWFFFVSYRELGVFNTDGYQGITFFDAPAASDSQLTCLGDIYKARSLGEPSVNCDAAGNTIDADGNVIRVARP